jgi:NADH-quinone oxidoreductase subunit E
MIDQEKLDAIFAAYEGDSWDLVPILHDIQEEAGFLPKEALKQVAQKLELPISQVFSVATFYKGFTLEPIDEVTRRLGDPETQYYSLTSFYPGFGRATTGQHHLKVCRGTACHLKGADRVLESVSRRLKIDPGQTTPDGQFSLEEVKCMGNCDKAPMLAVDRDFYNQVGIDRLTKILKPYRK